MRIVLTPEEVVLAEARRAYTTLSLFGYRVDGVVANRVFPPTAATTWRAGWVAAQDEVLAEVAESFAGVPVWRSAYRAGRAGRRRRARRASAGRCTATATRSPYRRRRSRSRITRTGSEPCCGCALPFVAGDRRRPRAGTATIWS